MARVSARWQDAMSALSRAALSVTTRPDVPPDRLYHFTDCVGLIGIFENGTLWASLATSMNDPSEVAFGLRLAHHLFEKRKIVAAHVDLSRVDLLVAERASDSRAYVVSFCADVNLAGQWLHYGRSGSGVAVGFRASSLVRPPFELFRVRYDDLEQFQLIRSVVAAIDDAVGAILPGLTTPTDQEALAQAAREVLADLLWKVFPRLKHPSFRAEQEWRLIAYEPRQVDTASGKPAGSTYFRGAAGRVVPFKKVEFAPSPLPAFEVVLGASCPMRPEELGIRVLMDEKLGTRLTVRTSAVPVRA